MNNMSAGRVFLTPSPSKKLQSPNKPGLFKLDPVSETYQAQAKTSTQPNAHSHQPNPWKFPLKTAWRFPLRRVTHGLLDQLSDWLGCVLTRVLSVPSDVRMAELKTCCHTNRSPRGDGWEPGIRRRGQQPRSTAQRPKGRTRNAHFFWQPRRSCFLTLDALSNVHRSLRCFQRSDHSLVFLLFSLAFSPPPSHADLFTCHPSDLFVFIQPCVRSWLVFMFLTFFPFSGDSCLSAASLPLYCFCYVYSHHFLLDIKIIGFFSPLFQTSEPTSCC